MKKQLLESKISVDCFFVLSVQFTQNLNFRKKLQKIPFKINT